MTVIQFMCIGSLMFVCNAAERPLAVCEVFKSPATYNGKIITVQGKLLAGREVFALGGAVCEESATATVEHTVRAISLSLTKKHQSKAEHESIRKMDILLSFLHENTADALGVDIFATFTGELRIDSGAAVFMQPGMPSPPKAYGHMGGFSAQLVYTRVEGIVICQKAALSAAEDSGRAVSSCVPCNK